MDIVKKYERLIKIADKAKAELAALKGLPCPHPKEHLNLYEGKDRNGGYGNWRDVRICSCKICGKSL